MHLNFLRRTLKNKGQACSCDFEVHRSGNTNYQLKGLSCGLESSLPIEDLNCSGMTFTSTIGYPE